MKKNVTLITLCSITILLIVSLVAVCIFCCKTNTENRDVMSDREIAMIIGKRVIEKESPGLFPNNEVKLVAESETGVWIVYTETERMTVLDDGRTAYTVGGEYMVILDAGTFNVLDFWNTESVLSEMGTDWRLTWKHLEIVASFYEREWDTLYD